MLELPYFGHMTTYTISFDSHDNDMDINYDVIYLYFEKSRVANFADIIKIMTILVNKIL